MEGPALVDLDAASLSVVFSHLSDSRQLALCECVCRGWLAAAASGKLWAQRLQADFGVVMASEGFPAPPPAQQCFERAKDAWQCWRKTFRVQGANMEKQLAAVRRMHLAATAWKDSLQSAGLESVARSFQDGLSPSELESFMSRDETPSLWRLKLPLALQALWCFLGGQSFEGHSEDELSSCLFWGALGGYSFYNNTVSMRMLPVQKALMATTALHMRGVMPGDLILLAANFNMHKRVLLHCVSGMVYISPSSSPPHYQPACNAPIADPELLPSDAPLVLWLENFVGKLRSGVLGAETLCREIEEETNLNTYGVSLYPRFIEPPEGVGSPPSDNGPWSSRCVTHGVEITCRPLYIPEMSDCTEDVDNAQLVFSYSVSMRLLDGYHIKECQLVRRHWVMRNAEGAVEDVVDGEGVIGKFPILRAGGPSFSYESCTRTGWYGGSMEGHLEFVNGTMHHEQLSAARELSRAQAMPAASGSVNELGHPAQGQTFNVAVGRFTMRRPDFIY